MGDIVGDLLNSLDATGYLTRVEREELAQEVRRLRAVEEAHNMLLRTVQGLPRPKPYYGSAIWELDQALGPSVDAAEPGV